MSISGKSIWKYTQLALFGILVYAIIQKFDLSKIQNLYLHLIERLDSQQSYVYISLCLLALGLHILLEAEKYRILLRQIPMKVSLSASLSMILRGLSTALISPNRTGEFVGRVYFIEAKERLKASIFSGICSFSQMIATFFFGLTSLVLLQSRYQLINLSSIVYLAFFGVPFLLLFVPRIRSFLKSKLKKSSFGDQLHSIRALPKTTYLKVLLLSFLRYLLFIAQLYFIFRALAVDVSFMQVLLAQSCLYFTLSFIPHNILVDISLRGALSLYFFQFLALDPSLILSAAYSLYFLNLLIPATVGLLFYLPIKDLVTSQS